MIRKFLISITRRRMNECMVRPDAEEAVFARYMPPTRALPTARRVNRLSTL